MSGRKTERRTAGRSDGSSVVWRRYFVITGLMFAMLVIGACSDGGGSSALPNTAATVTATSFIGYPLTQNGGLAPVYRNEAIQITFSGPLDASDFGGPALVPGTSTRVVMTGRTNALFGTVDYHPYADQAAARAAIRLWDDALAQLFESVVIGRRIDDPRTLVIDPHVDPLNTLGLTGTIGMPAVRQYDVEIPAASGLHSRGLSVAAFGGAPPAGIPGFSNTPAVSTLFLSSAYYLNDGVAPQVTEVTTAGLNGAPPPSASISPYDVIRVRFSEPIDAATIALGTNIVVRNKSLTSAQEPAGAQVLPVLTMAVDGRTLYLTPSPSFGPGPYQIEVSFPQPASPALAIKDLPSGPQGTQEALAAIGPTTFTTAADPSAIGSSTISEDFATTAHRDTTFNARYNPAVWNTGLGRIEGESISGSAAPGLPLGSRVQYTINPSTPAPLTAFFSPFDANGLNNFGGTVNPNGGSHSQFLYAAAAPEIPDGTHDTVELVEWGAAIQFGAPFPFTFNGFQMKLSHTTANPFVGSSFGLLSVFAQNYDFDNPQNAYLNPASHPGNLPLNEAPITVVPSQPYVIQSGFASTFVPFPNLTTLFDFDDGGRTEVSVLSNIATEPSLLVDIDIPAPVNESNNFVLGNFPLTPVPVRRMNGASGALLAFNTDNVATHMRFTFVSRNSSTRTVIYDAGVPSPQYNAFVAFPGINLRPAGTVITVKADAGASFSGSTFGTVGSVQPSALVTLIDRNGIAQTNAFDAISQRRYVRLTFEFESNTITNESPSMDSFLLGFSY